MTRKTIGILGGSFNPIHLGHIKICETILAKFPIEKCLLMPNYHSPNKWTQDMISSEHRLAMIKLALNEYKDLGIGYSTWEIDQKTVSYTINTLKHFVAEGVDPMFIMGADAFRDIAGWKDYRQIFETADIAVVSRPTHFDASLESLVPPTMRMNFEHVPRPTSEAKSSFQNDPPSLITLKHLSGKHCYFLSMPPFTVSSTELRARLAEGKDCLDYLPESVLNYIYQNKLYGT